MGITNSKEETTNEKLIEQTNRNNINKQLKTNKIPRNVREVIYDYFEFNQYHLVYYLLSKQEIKIQPVIEKFQKYFDVSIKINLSHYFKIQYNQLLMHYIEIFNQITFVIQDELTFQKYENYFYFIKQLSYIGSVLVNLEFNNVKNIQSNERPFQAAEYNSYSYNNKLYFVNCNINLSNKNMHKMAKDFSRCIMKDCVIDSAPININQQFNFIKQLKMARCVSFTHEITKYMPQLQDIQITTSYLSNNYLSKACLQNIKSLRIEFLVDNFKEIRSNNEFLNKIQYFMIKHKMFTLQSIDFSDASNLQFVTVNATTQQNLISFLNSLKKLKSSQLQIRIQIQFPVCFQEIVNQTKPLKWKKLVFECDTIKLFCPKKFKQPTLNFLAHDPIKKLNQYYENQLWIEIHQNKLYYLQIEMEERFKTNPFTIKVLNINAQQTFQIEMGRTQLQEERIFEPIDDKNMNHQKC